MDNAVSGDSLCYELTWAFADDDESREGASGGWETTGGGGGGFSGGAGTMYLNGFGGGGGSFLAPNAVDPVQQTGGNLLDLGGNGEVTFRLLATIQVSAPEPPKPPAKPPAPPLP